ncbi:MAG: sulfatase-like hydrolase/transferase [Pirellulaceae bacterium]
MLRLLPPCLLLFLATTACAETDPPNRPNIVLVMADDQGWGQTGYAKHPVLKTPHLDALADGGLRLNRYYAAAPVCSPTRASVLTGRTNQRTGVQSHGYALRRQEKTLAQALQSIGYATAHFGKWHLNGLRGPGVPILADDTHHPGKFGFDQWLSVTNYFDRDPILSRQGTFEEYKGDSSEIVVEEAVKFIQLQAKKDCPSFTVIWYGTPHAPFRAHESDTRAFDELNEASRRHYGELVALDRSLGTLRQGLEDAGVLQDTLIWYTSDNGGLPNIKPDTVGGLRGYKGSLYEGGLRVPSVIHWPAMITQPRVSAYPTVAMDIFPTIADIVGLPESVMLQPSDGVSLRPLFTKEIGRREKPIGFRCFGTTAIVDNDIKLIQSTGKKGKRELYNLAEDPHETTNLYRDRPEIAKRMQDLLDRFDASIDDSIKGLDYPEGTVDPSEPEPRFWSAEAGYQPYLEAWEKRPEYSAWIRARRNRRNSTVRALE